MPGWSKRARRRRVGLAADHRRRGRPCRQWDGQAARMGCSTRRALGCLPGRRADQSRCTRRHDQDRPARLGVGHSVTVKGVQGHAAYPHLADNPVRGALSLARSLMFPAFDTGTRTSSRRTSNVTTIDVGNAATNVIPASARTSNSTSASTYVWTADSVKAEIVRRLDAAAVDPEFGRIVQRSATTSPGRNGRPRVPVRATMR